MTRVRAVLASRYCDIVLAVIGLAITQLQLIKQPAGWMAATLPIQLLIAVGPALIAIRKVEPVLASGGLVLGAYLSTTETGELSYPILIGAALALWSLAYRRIRRTAVVERTFRERLTDLRSFLLTTVALDAVLAMVVTSLILSDLGRDIGRGNWWSAPGWMPYAIAFSALTLVLRRKWPAVPVVVLALSALLTYWQTSTSWSVLGALAIALYFVAASRPLRFSLPVATVVLAVAPTIAVLVRYPQMVLIFPELKRQPLTFGDFDDGILHNRAYEHLVDHQWPVTLSLILLLPVTVGVLARLYRRNRSAAAREAELEQRAVEQDAAQVVLTERSVIARDLHDVVAHAVNLMVIQAETGPDLLKRGDVDALAGFQRIGDAGRRALGELDRMLSALRDEEGLPDPALSPQPGLGDLDQLAKNLSDQGQPVELEVRGASEGVPAGIQLTAYRLVQEALTNVVKHAKADRATILVENSEAGIAVWVVDNGQGFDPETRATGRHGLTGMQERVRIHNGTLTITSSPGAGTTISAWLPVSTR
jgi:signal transduction histidine kinase